MVVNGTKIWRAARRLMMFRADRPGAKAPRHHVLPPEANTPGSVSLLSTWPGYGFQRVFFDNVRVKHENVIGEPNRGWYVATTTSTSNVPASTAAGAPAAQ
jgi:alkylation response protein AidB-like acyl-CoA dehydrogenase